MKFATAKQTELAAYEQVRLTPFTTVHGRPSRIDRNTLREELCAAASEIEMPFEQAGDYGLLGEIMEDEEYTALTGLEYAEPIEPENYDSDITEDMPDHERKRMEASHIEYQEAWYTRRGALRGLCDNIRDALDVKYFQALKRPVIAYKKVTVKEYINHLDSKWCKLDTRVVKLMKNHYYRGWQVENDEDIHDYVKRLDEEQEKMSQDGITISTDDKLQHFMEEMYDSGQFDRRDYRGWEDRPDFEKTWEEATSYFEAIIEAMETYEDNVGGTAKKSRYESAAQVEERQQQQTAEDKSLQQFLSAAAAKDEQIQLVTANQTSMVTMQTQMQEMMATMKQQMRDSTMQIAALKKEVAQKSYRGNEDKENTNPNTGGGGNGGEEKKAWEKCNHCGRKHAPWQFNAKNGKKCWLHPDNKSKTAENGGPPAGFTKVE